MPTARIHKEQHRISHSVCLSLFHGEDSLELLVGGHPPVFPCHIGSSHWLAMSEDDVDARTAFDSACGSVRVPTRLRQGHERMHVGQVCWVDGGRHTPAAQAQHRTDGIQVLGQEGFGTRGGHES